MVQPHRLGNLPIPSSARKQRSSLRTPPEREAGYPVKAGFMKGVLQITLPKSPQARSAVRRIPITES
jgi:hypothetical protein